MTFDDLMLAACGFVPYDYQRRIADEGLPELLEVPTGSGKTMAAVLPWLYRRHFHPDPSVRDRTPPRFVLALPMRVLVEQTVASATTWVSNLDLARKVGVYTLMGGERRDARWRLELERDAVLIGTIDMLLSRALNRGYGESRFSWPIDFGLLSAGTQWVFDEVQLLGPALPTSRQLEGLRAVLGTAAPTASMWMSATVDQAALCTVDSPAVGRVVGLTESDRTGPLAGRLYAAKTLHELDLGSDVKARPARLAAELIQRHRRGTRTIAILNTVDRARELAMRISKLVPDLPVILVHSRFRPPDRARVVERVTAPIDPDGPGVIVVSTQVLEAGVDVSSELMFTEAAPWASVVQRTGRCNRDGTVEGGGTVLWAPPPKPAPYEPKDLDCAIEQLRALDGQAVSPASLSELQVDTVPVIHPVLRRRDLIELFDTTPDLSGSDVDVSRFIRTANDTDVAVAWWDLGTEAPAKRRSLPARDERCPVPIGDLAGLKSPIDERRAWRRDHLDGWVRCRRSDLRPGMVVVLDSIEGGYVADAGWLPASKAPVPVVGTDDCSEAETPAGDGAVTDEDVEVDADPLSSGRRCWLSLTRHLADVESEVRVLFEHLHLPGLDGRHRRAAAEAGRLHDIGKAHHVFQQSVQNTAANDEERAEAVRHQPPLAKSGGSGRLRHSRRYFRHELASALALLGSGAPAISKDIDESDRDLIVYLVAAHHGRVRMGFRSLPDEDRPDDISAGTQVALGIVHGDPLPAVEIPRGVVPASTMDLTHMTLGADIAGRPSWSARAMALRDRKDLGPFRLATLEALVRMADWRASDAADKRGRS